MSDRCATAGYRKQVEKPGVDNLVYVGSAGRKGVKGSPYALLQRLVIFLLSTAAVCLFSGNISAQGQQWYNRSTGTCGSFCEACEQCTGYRVTRTDIDRIARAGYPGFEWLSGGRVLLRVRDQAGSRVLIFEPRVDQPGTMVQP
jgi:hypothetical protein